MEVILRGVKSDGTGGVAEALRQHFYDYRMQYLRKFWGCRRRLFPSLVLMGSGSKRIVPTCVPLVGLPGSILMRPLLLGCSVRRRGPRRPA